MSNRYLILIDLVYPFVFGLIILIIFISDIFKRPVAGAKRPAKDATIQIPLIFFVFEKRISKRWLIRTVLVLTSVFFFIWPAFRDYANSFPTHMRMEVFFDDKGTLEALNQFGEEELKRLNLADNWQTEKISFIDSTNRMLENIKYPFNFDSAKGVVRSKGENSFVVRKVENWGWQTYHIETGKGSLEHKKDVVGKGTITATSTFELLETDGNYMDLSLSDIYLNWTKMIMPTYTQKFSISPSETHYSHNLIAATKVRFFPYLDLGKTIYLSKQPNGDKYIPIGYAFYYPD